MLFWSCFHFFLVASKFLQASPHCHRSNGPTVTMKILYIPSYRHQFWVYEDPQQYVLSQCSKPLFAALLFPLFLYPVLNSAFLSHLALLCGPQSCFHLPCSESMKQAWDCRASPGVSFTTWHSSLRHTGLNGADPLIHGFLSINTEGPSYPWVLYA